MPAVHEGVPKLGRTQSALARPSGLRFVQRRLYRTEVEACGELRAEG